MKKQIVTLGLIFALSATASMDSMAGSVRPLSAGNGGYTNIELASITATVLLALGTILKIVADAASSVQQVRR